MKRKILNWHEVKDAIGRDKLIGIFECGHFLHFEGDYLPELLPRVEACGVCAAEAEGAPKPSTVPPVET